MKKLKILHCEDYSGIDQKGISEITGLAELYYAYNKKIKSTVHMKNLKVRCG